MYGINYGDHNDILIFNIFTEFFYGYNSIIINIKSILW